MRLGSILQRISRFRPLILLGGAGLLLAALPSCTQDALNNVWIDALEGAATAGLPAFFDAIRLDVLDNEGTTDTIPTVLLNTIDTLRAMTA